MKEKSLSVQRHSIVVVIKSKDSIPNNWWTNNNAAEWRV